MRHQLLIPALLLFVFFANSCRETSNLGVEIIPIPIKNSLSVEILDFEVLYEAHKEYLGSLLFKPIVINSIEQLDVFETLNIEVPYALQQFDFEKYTFLLSFHIDIKSLKDIRHELWHNFETGQYTYIVTFLRNSSDEFSESEILLFYTGILVDKISIESKIDIVKYVTTDKKVINQRI